MIEELFKWLLGLVDGFATFGNWLITPLFLGWTPLSLISVGGLTTIIAIWVVKFLNPLA